MASGSGGQLALTRSDSLYLSVTSVDQWTNFVSESVQHTLNELEEGALTGYKDAPPSHKGLDYSQGDIQFEPNPNAFGHFMRGAFGQASGSVLTAAGSWGTGSSSPLWDPFGVSGRPVMQHRFIPIQSAWDLRTFLPPYTMMVYKDVGSAWFFQGTCFHTIEWQIQAGQLVKATVSVMARKTERYSRTASISALRTPGGRPWVWDMASVQVSSGQTGFANLLGNTNFESITLRLETPLEGVVLLDGNKQYAEFQVNGFRRVNLSGTLSFRDQTEYDAFVAYENRSMRVNLTNTTSALRLGNPNSLQYFGLQLDVPQMKFLSYGVPIQGPNRLQSQFTAKGELDPTSTYMIEALLINTTSAY